MVKSVLNTPASIDGELQPLRDQIDALDKQIIQALNQRAALAQQVGVIKHQHGVPVFRPEREAQVLRHVAEQNPGPLRSEDLCAIYREIISACRATEKVQTVAYLGPTGTFSEAAALLAFGHGIELLPCASIDEVFRAAEAGTADFGVVPVENSTEGVVNRTLDLFLNSPLKISSEVTIPVHHNLMTQSGGMNGVSKVCAHGQALAQCATWLATHYPQLERLAVASNAEAARLATQDASVAAIASEAAATHYQLPIVARHIEDDPRNTTRFAVIGALETAPSGKDQTSVVVSVPNVAGSVYKMLEPLSRHQVSMTRFESRPSRTGVWSYYFYIDLEGHTQETQLSKALEELRAQCGFFKVLGSYPLA